MTTTTGNNGRLGNQIIRNLELSQIAKKHDLSVEYYNPSAYDQLGIPLFSGRNTYSRTEKLSDENYFTTYYRDQIDFNLDPNQAYFQSINQYL